MFEIPENIEHFIYEYSDQEDPLLYELYRETHKKILHPRMLSGHLQGKLLEMITKMITPLNVLEIGTYTGYSAICIARGLKKGSKLHTIEINDELEDFINHYLNRSGNQDKISLHIGNALEIIPQIPNDFDLIFIDGDKREYPDYLTICKQRLNSGGFILADNVFWGGKATEEHDKSDPHTNGIKTFNNMIKNDPELEKLILPIRDGLMLVRKK